VLMTAATTRSPELWFCPHIRGFVCHFQQEPQGPQKCGCVHICAGLCDDDSWNHENISGKESEVGLSLPPGGVAATCTLVFNLAVRIHTFSYLYSNRSTTTNNVYFWLQIFCSVHVLCSKNYESLQVSGQSYLITMNNNNKMNQGHNE